MVDQAASTVTNGPGSFAIYQNYFKDRNMVSLKIQILLIGAVVVGVGAAFWLVTALDETTAQAQGVTGVASLESQPENLRLDYQEVYTKANSLVDTEFLEGRSEVVGDIQTAIAKIEADAADLSGQSINAGYEYIPASAFKHDGISPGSGYRFFPTSGYIRNASASQMCLAAPVYAPNGATFTNVFIFFIDNSASSDFSIVLRRHNLALPSQPAQTVVAGTLTGIDDNLLRFGFFDPFQATLGTGTVSNDYGYTTTFCFAPNTGLEQLMYGVIVTYN
jgi:hypothetical protein